MRRRNEIDVVAAQLILKIKHPFRQSTAIDLFGFLLFPVLAYLVVLTIDSSHITVSEEDRSRPFCS